MSVDYKFSRNHLFFGGYHAASIRRPAYCSVYQRQFFNRLKDLLDFNFYLSRSAVVLPSRSAVVLPSRNRILI
ncbi:unnamed protein product [Cuscuta campestris]|uniref:Uncharacterized protein n=1 Tax=Cuscuta campestris TaxID=132261 RepID=A0A484KRA8_9ASTE|nr:unnamed protein product [Cuscuta campestris]